MNVFRVLIRSVSNHLHELDERSRQRMWRDEERQSIVAEERSDRRAAQEQDIALFVQGLPSWVTKPELFADPVSAAQSIDPAEVISPEGATPGTDWVVAVDLELDRAETRWQRFWSRSPRPERWVLARPGSRRRHAALARGTRLRLIGQSSAARRRPEEETTLTIADAPTEDRGLAFEVLDGGFPGRRVHVASLSRWPSGPALVAAAMVAPAGHRIVDWQSAADSVRARLESRLAAAERSSRELAYEARWAWRHDLIGRPIVTTVRVRRERSEDERRPK